MLQELLKIFKSGDALSGMANDFAEMLKLSCEMTATAGAIYFHEPVESGERTRIYEKDVAVNKLERDIRKRVVAHVSTHGNTPDLPYCLLLMSLVKDVERIGDYAKNVSEVVDIYSGDLPDDDVLAELREIRSGVESALEEAGRVFRQSDREAALGLLRKGKDYAERSDRLLSRIAGLDYDSGKTAALILGARYYKRIGGHLLNVLSSVVMPLHKVDYYDEDEVKQVSAR